MTDPCHPVIDLTDVCSLVDHGNLDSAVIELLDDSWETSRSPRRNRGRGRSLSTRHIENEEPIEITESPQVNTHALDLSVRRRKVAKTSKKKKQESQLNKYTDDLVRDRSPLGGSFGVCPICLETLGMQPLVSTKCGHVYCHKCLTQALRSEKKCPTCRKVLRGSTAYHPLFLNRG